MKFNPSNIQPSLLDMMPKYERISDCIMGGDAIKEKGETYLPKPDPTNYTEENNARYKQYLIRALFYGITARTVNGMLGLVYSKPQPEFDLHANLEYIKTNIDGSGITLTQQTKKVIHDVSALGRAGLLTDYSKSNSEVSQQDVIDGKVRAVIKRYNAENILWAETQNKGVENILSLVILLESYVLPAGDGYTSKTDVQFRVLSLADGIYGQEIYRKIDGKDEFEAIEAEGSIPVDNSGAYFDHIPFTFVGAVNNDHKFDNPPMLSIADLNIAHYRNSADYEESCFVNGQPTYYFTGLTKSWIDDVLKGIVRIGSRGGVPLPEGAGAGILQADANTLPAEGMKTKETQMAAIGAQIVTGDSGTTTATEINRNSTVEDSVLVNIVSNVEQAYNFCFQQVTLFTGIEIPEYGINKEFNYESFDSSRYTSLINGAMQGLNTKEDAFNYLKRTGMVNYDVEFESWNNTIDNSIPGVI